MALRALDEKRPHALAQPADERPVAHFGFGDKPGSDRGIDEKDVQPRHVIRDEHQRTLARGLSLARNRQPHTQDGKEPPRPGLDLSPTMPGTLKREKKC